MAFRIEWKKSTRKDLRKLPSATVDKIIEAVEDLAENPFLHGVEKLSGSETIGLSMKLSRNQSWLKFSACATAKMSIVFENLQIDRVPPHC
jgi:hypothetical protein